MEEKKSIVDILRYHTKCCKRTEKKRALTTHVNVQTTVIQETLSLRPDHPKNRENSDDSVTKVNQKTKENVI